MSTSIPSEPGRSVRTSARASRTRAPKRSVPCKVCHWTAGVDPRVIDDPDVSASWNVLALIGALVFQNSAIATAEVYAILRYFYYVRPEVALISGIAWGVVLLNCERAMLGSIHKGARVPPWKLILMIASRVGLTVLMAITIGKPAELLMNSRRVDVELAVEHNAESAAQRKGIEVKYSGRLAELDSVIASNGRDVARYDSLAGAALDSATCDGDGTCGVHNPILGPRYRAKVERANQQRLAAEHAHAVHEPRIAEAVIARERVTGERDAEVARFKDIADHSDDLVARQIALGHLEQQPDVGPIVRRGGLIIQLVALVLELLALGLKLLSDPGPYDYALVAVLEGQSRAWIERSQTLKRDAELGGKQERAAADALDNAAMGLAAGAAKEAGVAVGEDLSVDIVAHATSAARRAASRAFDGEHIAREVANRVARRRDHAVEHVVEAEAGVRTALNELDNVVADASALRTAGMSDTGPESARELAAD